jgi:hypothetical protein
MPTFVSNGTGRLYDAGERETLATIAYRIYRNPATEQRAEEWWGSFALNLPVAEMSEYTLEMEDGRKGVCSLEVRKVQQITESLTFYHYDLRGIGVLK